MLKKSIILSGLLLSVSTLNALTLKESVQLALDTNPEIMAERSNQEAYKRYVDDAESDYYPRVDLSAYLEKSNVKNDYDDNTTDTDTTKDGYRANLKLEQMLYDGGLTPAEVDKAKYIRDGNKYKTNQNIETVVLNVVDAYDGLVQYRELLQLTNDMIQTNENNLITAKEKEDISGEILETYQVSSKLNLVTEQFLEEQTLAKEQSNALIRYIGTDEIDGYVCRPKMDPMIVPDTLQEAIEIAVKQNFEILEQVEKIKERRENIAIADANFLPNLTLELQGSFDEDLKLPENGSQEELIARLNLNWNLFNGGKDANQSEQEKLFLKESKEDLEGVTRRIVATTKDLYFEYHKNKDRIEVLKNYVVANENIVKVYKEEFDAGTRTFVDILNAETELYESRQSLRNREFALLDNYYNLMYTFSILSRSILGMADSPCTEPQPVKAISKPEPVEDDLEALVNDKTEEELLPLEEPEPIADVPPFLQQDMQYTLNMATYISDKGADIFANGLLERSEGYVYKIFNDNQLYNKVIYKRFDTRAEAQAAYDALDPEIIRVHRPYIDILEKHRKLYIKYIRYNQ